MKKKFYMMIVLAMLAMSVLTGCGNEKNENMGTDGSQMNGTEGTATTDEREMEDSQSREKNDTDTATSDTTTDNKDGIVGDVITDVSEELTEM